MLTIYLKTLLLTFLATPASPEPAVPDCQRERYEAASYTICRFDRDDAGLGVYLYDDTGHAFGDFDALKTSLNDQGQDLAFAMNGGMYHEDRSPVGLFISEGRELAPLQSGEGYGNFHLLPNGVFYIDDAGAQVLEAEAYKKSGLSPKYATQSGPMLVINGALHPKFNADSTSLKRRNGVGVNESKNEVYFVISDGFVSFHRFASLFRDYLGSENALYLDGTISRLYAPDMKRNDVGAPMGPIIAITRTEANKTQTDLK